MECGFHEEGATYCRNCRFRPSWTLPSFSSSEIDAIKDIQPKAVWVTGLGHNGGFNGLYVCTRDPVGVPYFVQVGGVSNVIWFGDLYGWRWICSHEGFCHWVQEPGGLTRQVETGTTHGTRCIGCGSMSKCQRRRLPTSSNSNPRRLNLASPTPGNLLKDDISTALRGKAISSTVYPLSFAEYLRFTKVEAKPASTKGQAEIRARFDDYLKWGGYPALTGTAEPSREVLLREYFDTMILKDIVQRFNVGKPQQCIDLYHYLLSNIGRPYTLKSAYEFLKQGVHATSRDAVRDYVAWAEDAWLLFTIPIHSQSQKEQERNYRKVYGIDWTLAIRNSSVWDGSYARAFENMVYLHLRRIYPRVRYYLTRSKRQEVDFLVSDERGKPISAIQVSMEISHPDTLRRDLEPLVSTATYFGTQENLIITVNQERRFDEGGVVVHALPARRWTLLDSPFADAERVRKWA